MKKILLILGLINFSLVFGQIETEIVGADTLCIGESFEYSVNVDTYPNGYLFKENATDGNLSFGYSGDIFTNTFSFDFWVKPTRTINMAGESNTCSGGVSVPLANSNQNWAIYASNAGYGNMGVGLTIGTNGLMIAEHSEYILVSRLSYSVSITDWVHVAVVYRTDSIFLYLNGNLVRSRPTHCTSNTKFIPGTIAASRYSPEFQGNIDEFRLWDIPLTAEQVQDIKDKKLINQVEGLRYYASFDNGKFERTLGDIGDANMTVTGLTTTEHLKASLWDLDKYTGTSINSLTLFSENAIEYLWSTGSTTQNTSFSPLVSTNHLWVNTYNASFSKYDSMVVIGENCQNDTIINGGLDGLIAYYPLDGNANDESGNNHNGTTHGVTLTEDRFGNQNSAYEFNGINNYIELPNIIPIDVATISYWFKTDTIGTSQVLVYNSSTIDNGFGSIHDALETHTGLSAYGGFYNFKNGDISVPQVSFADTLTIQANNWYYITLTYDINGSIKYYVNGIQVNSQDISGITFGSHMPTYTYVGRPSMNTRYFDGVFDDLRIYSKVLNDSEIFNLYNGNVCFQTVYDTVTVVVYDTVHSPSIGEDIQYIKYESTYSADNGQVNVYEIQAYTNGENVALNKLGYANSYEYGDYASNGSRAVDNNGNSRWSSDRDDAGPDSDNPHFIVIDLQEKYALDSVILDIKGFDSWNQTFSLLASPDSVNWFLIGSGEDTTGIVSYNSISAKYEIIYDTVAVYDTNFVSVNDTISVYDTILVYETITTTVYDSVAVTDTLIINAVLTGVDEPNNINTLLIYPNPARDHIFINTGDYTKMVGYTMKIINQVGVTVFETNIEDPLYELNLSSWTGNGLYFVQIIDSGGQVIDTRKIIIQ